ncbi:cyclase [Candidatus Dependentiae bacterium Noda2021]|nr:cyclase [Candidatus Dependentiae bacterium Noda2021]
MSFPFATIIDLTHPLSTDHPTWDGDCGFELHTLVEHEDGHGPTQFTLQGVTFAKIGIGTHIDAPAHCFAHGVTVDQLPIEQLVTNAYVIDISSKAHAHYALSTHDIVEFEKHHCTIAHNSLVIVHTGWSKFWHNKDAYRNVNQQGVMQFPTISSAAAELLLARGIAGIAIDTLSPDASESDFPVHRLLLGNGKYIIENLANAQKLTPVGALVCALPIKIQTTESPVRVVGIMFK